MKFTKKHVIFIIIGCSLSLSCIILSQFDSIKSTNFNAWSLENISTNYSGFFSNHFLRLGILEILLLFFRNRICRISAILISFLKIALPWGFYYTYNCAGTKISDLYFYKTICNILPYLITVFAICSIIHEILMFFVLCKKEPSENLS